MNTEVLGVKYLYLHPNRPIGAEQCIALYIMSLTRTYKTPAFTAIPDAYWRIEDGVVCGLLSRTNPDLSDDKITETRARWVRFLASDGWNDPNWKSMIPDGYIPAIRTRNVVKSLVEDTVDLKVRVVNEPHFPTTKHYIIQGITRDPYRILIGIARDLACAVGRLYLDYLTRIEKENQSLEISPTPTKKSCGGNCNCKTSDSKSTGPEMPFIYHI